MNVGRIQKNRKSEAEYPGGGKQQANRESLVHSNFEMTWLNSQVLGGAFDSKYLDAGKLGNQPSLAWIIENTTKKESCLDVYRLKSYIEGIEYQMDLLDQPRTNMAVYVTLCSSQLQTPEADCEFVGLLFVFFFFSTLIQRNPNQNAIRCVREKGHCEAVLRLQRRLNQYQIG